MAGTRKPKSVYRFLDTVGNGSGSSDMSVDGSSTAVPFMLAAAAGETLVVNRVIISYRDANGMTAAEFGNLGTALTNGITVKKYDGDDNLLLDLLDGEAIKINAGWGRVCYDVDIKSWGQTPDDDILVARWTFGKAGVGLYLRDGEYLEALVQDNLTGLTDMSIMGQGFTLTENQ